MGLGDIAGQASEMAGQHGDKVEQASDQGLDKAAQAVNDKTGNKFGDQVEQGKQQADERMGDNSQ